MSFGFCPSLSQPTPQYPRPIRCSAQDLLQVVDCWEEFPTVSQAWSLSRVPRRPLCHLCPVWPTLPTWLIYSVISDFSEKLPGNSCPEGPSSISLPGIALIDRPSSHLSPRAVFLIINDSFVCRNISSTMEGGVVAVTRTPSLSFLSSCCV